MDDREVRERVARLEELLARIEGEALATDAVQGLVDLYGEALRRLVVERADPVEDELVSHLLLVHDLHPIEVEVRVRQALDDVRPYLASHGGDVELLEIADGVARLRLEGTCNGCPSSAVTLQTAIEEAIQRAAPELERIDAEGVAEPKPQLLQIGALQCPTELSAQ